MPGLILILLPLGGCSAESSDDPEPFDPEPPDSPAYERSPIVYGSYDPPGTFFSTVDDPTPRHLNDIYDYFPISLSPARERVLQVTNEASLVHELAEDGAELASFEYAGEFLGWEGEGTLLFATPGTEGLTRISIDSGASNEIAFPRWVMRESNGPLGLALSPDAKAAAFLVWTEDENIVSTGSAVFVMDTRNGAVLATWPIEGDVFPGRIIWARDGTILYYSFEAPVVMTATVGDGTLSEPITVPFRPCNAEQWVEPGVLHMGEWVAHLDTAYCGNSWLIDTDGSNPVMREGQRPTAISPDGKRILLLDDMGALSVAKPNGNGEEPIPGLPKVHDVVW